MKKEIAKLCVSFALLMGGIATSGTVSLILCIAAFLLCGAEVVINAVKNIASLNNLFIKSYLLYLPQCPQSHYMFVLTFL